MIAKLTKNIFTSRNPARNEKSLGNAGPVAGSSFGSAVGAGSDTAEMLRSVIMLEPPGEVCFLATGLPSAVTAGFISNKIHSTIVPLLQLKPG